MCVLEVFRKRAGDGVGVGGRGGGRGIVAYEYNKNQK